MGQAQLQTTEAGFAQRISALMDGEVAAHEVAAAVELAKDGEGAAHWREYQLIGDVLRSEDLLNTRSSEDFLGRFAAKLDAEPHLLVPAVAQRAQAEERHRFLVRPSWVRRVMPTTAVAAAVAAVSWVVVPQLRGPVEVVLAGDLALHKLHRHVSTVHIQHHLRSRPGTRNRPEAQARQG